MRWVAVSFFLFWACVLAYLGCDIGKDVLWPKYPDLRLNAFVAAAAEFSISAMLFFGAFGLALHDR